MPKAVIYARVSSKEQEKEGYSIPAQLKLLQEYAAKRELKIVQEFTDSETAKKQGRQNFNAMVSFLKQNPDTKIVLVEKTDRLYRNFKDYILIDDLDLEVHLVKEGSVMSQESRSHDKFIHGIKVLMAKNYIDNLSEEIRKGLQEKAEQGYWPLKPPYGYKKGSDKVVQIDEELAPFVRRAFELYSKGDISLEAVSHTLKQEGFIYRSYEPKIKKGTLEKMLKNLFYKGSFVFRGMVYSGLHEPIISYEVFEDVQKAFKKDFKQHYDAKKFTFKGLIVCADCGCSILGELKKKKYVYYHCSWGRGKDKCSNRDYIREEKLEEQFDEAIRKIELTEIQKEWLIEALKISFKEKQNYHREKTEALSTQVKKLRERLDKLYIDKLDGRIDEEFWLQKHNEWKLQLIKIKSILDSHDEAHYKFLNEGISIIELLYNIHHKYLNRSLEEKVDLLKILFSNCKLKDGKLSYEYKKPFNLFVKGIDFEFKWR
jgi:DNA invertase Pin-like site-specific DNA recombinase